MELETLTVVMAVAGLVLLYGAVTNRNPLEVIQKAVSGEDISTASPLSRSGGTAGNDPPPGAVDGSTLPGTPQADGDARTDPPQFDPNREDVLPILPGERQPFNPGYIPPGAI